jgi:hypothetical protein
VAHEEVLVGDSAEGRALVGPRQIGLQGSLHYVRASDLVLHTKVREGVDPYVAWPTRRSSSVTRQKAVPLCGQER